MVGVLLVVLSVGVTVDMFACGDKFLIALRGTRNQRPTNARAANVLIYASPGSAMAATLKKERIEFLLRLDHHRVSKVETLPKLSTSLGSGRYDVILTTNGDMADVKGRLQAADAPDVVSIDGLLKNYSLLDAIDKEVLKRDQNLKKTPKR
jgi:hypothetical protein